MVMTPILVELRNMGTSVPNNVQDAKGKFNVTRQALVHLRNDNQAKLKHMNRVFPALDVEGKKWSAAEERLYGS